MRNMEPRPLEFGEIDAFVEEVDLLADISHSDRSRFLQSRWLPYTVPPELNSGGRDPYGGAYLAWVLAQWRFISGRQNYAVELEHDDNVTVTREQLQRLYPFVSGDMGFISRYMMGVWHLLSLLEGLPNRKIVEYGVGWGNTTLAMIQAGFSVLAVDIDPKWLGLLKLRADGLGLSDYLRTFHGQFGDLPAAMDVAGGFVFYECFHHALNHDETLKRVTASLADGGFVLFGGEPILRDFPIDWGLRLDGHSIWAIRRYGWMELAYSEDYFIRLTRRHHLALSRHEAPELGAFGLAYKAVLDKMGVALGHSLLSSCEHGFFEPELDAKIHTRFTTGDAVLELPCGALHTSIELKNWLSVPLSVRLEMEGSFSWHGILAPGITHLVIAPNCISGYFRRMRIISDAHIPSELGMNRDTRRLGVAIGRVRNYS